MCLVIDHYSNSDGEQFINNVVNCSDDYNIARQYMKEYALESLREYEDAGTFKSIVEKKDSVTVKAEHSTDYFEIYFMNC